MIKKLNASVLALALLAAVPAPVSAQYTQSQISSQINSGLPSNGQNGITAANLRAILSAMDAAIFQGLQYPSATLPPGTLDTILGYQNGAQVQFPANPGAIQFDAVGGTNPRTMAQRSADEVNVMEMAGAANNDTGNQGPVINAAEAAAVASGATQIHLPAGVYHINLSAASSTIVPVSNMTWVGDGKGRTIIDCDDSGEAAAPWQGCSALTGNNSINDFHVKGITFKGRVATSPVGSGTTLFAISPNPTGNQFNCSNISVEDSEFIEGRYFGLVVKSCDGVLIKGNHVARMARDGIDVWDAPNALITENQIENSNDDAIACSQASNSSNGSNPASPVPSGCNITNNNIQESQGIRVLGAKVINVTGNVMRRMLGQGIYIVAATNSTGGATATANFAVNVTGNVITDVFTRAISNPYNSESGYIQVSGGPKSVLVDSFGSAGGTGLLYENQTDSGGSNAGTSPGGGWFNISGNVLTRTLPAETVGYTDWGYSSLGLWECYKNGGGVSGSTDITCGYDNTPIPESNMEQNALQITGPLRESRIADNIIAGGKDAIEFTATSVNSLDYDDLEIVGNRLSDCYGGNACIYFSGNSSYQRISIRNNTIDGDPRFASAARGTNGTWSGTGPFGINMANITAGLSIIGNTFRNVQNTIQGTTTGYHIEANRVYANPAGGLGCSTSNVGVKCIPNSGPDFINIQEDANPNSGTYGEILSANTQSAQAMPSSGTWVAGTFVQNNGPGACEAYGWLRLTTGSGNVAGTDWQTVYTGQQQSTWANIPSASGNTGCTIQVTDVGVGGSLWASDGTRWHPLYPITLVSEWLNTAVTGTTTETTSCGPITIPAGALGLFGSFEVFEQFTYTANTDTKTMRVYWGPNGNNTDTLLQPLADTNSSDSQARYTIGAFNENSQSANYLYKGQYGNGGAGTGLSSALTINSAVTTYLTTTVQLGTSTDSITQNICRIRLNP